jgi:hypothetical protein
MKILHKNKKEKEEAIENLKSGFEEYFQSKLESIKSIKNLANIKLEGHSSAGDIANLYSQFMNTKLNLRNNTSYKNGNEIINLTSNFDSMSISPSDLNPTRITNIDFILNQVDNNIFK